MKKINKILSINNNSTPYKEQQFEKAKNEFRKKIDGFKKLNLEFPRQILDDFKLACMHENQSMTEVILKFIIKYLKEKQYSMKKSSDKEMKK